MSIRSILLVVSGAAMGVALVISCGNPTPAADAADVCNCPSAEPPLAGRVVRVQQTGDIPASTEFYNLRAYCAAGATVVGGGCRLAGPSTQVTLRENGPDPQQTGDGWYCGFGNSSAAPISATATVICLNPAQ